MRTPSTKAPLDHERQEQELDDVQPIRRRTGEEEDAEVAEDDLEYAPDDASDHTLEKLDEDDLAYMQGPDA